MQCRVKRWCSFALVIAVLNTAACGYLIYPERQGLRGDRVDGTVVALDAIGLLLILPGIIAFAVDFSTGCIYLPKGKEGPFSMNSFDKNSFNGNKPAPDGWIAVAQVAPFADDATIAAALQNHLRNGDRNGAPIEWISTPAFTQWAGSN